MPRRFQSGGGRAGDVSTPAPSNPPGPLAMDLFDNATPVPVPDAYTRDVPPPIVTIYGELPPRSVEVSDGTLQLRFVHPRFAVTSELTDPAPPGRARPVVTVARGHDGTPDVSVSGGGAHVRIVGWNDPDAPPSGA